MNRGLRFHAVSFWGLRRHFGQVVQPAIVRCRRR